MTAAIRNLHVLAYAAGHTSWLYKGAQTRENADTPGYFDAMHDMMAPGDTITIVATDGVAMRYVVSTAGGVVVLGRVT